MSKKTRINKRPHSEFMRNRSGPVVDIVKKGKPVRNVNDDDHFLKSFEWRKVRMQALKRYGAQCQCCGATPAHGLMMHVDHIKPRKTHPKLALDLDNLQILCEVCNHGKSNWDDTDWRVNPFGDLALQLLNKIK